MEKIIFKDDIIIYFIEGEELCYDYLRKISKRFPNLDLSNIKHLDDVEVLYHYKDSNSDNIFSVCYEYNGRFVPDKYWRKKGYVWFSVLENLTKDHTLINLKLL